MKQDKRMDKKLFDFRHADAVSTWSAIDDRVMGGVSRSQLRHDSAGHAVFEGEVALDNNGGFASVRSSLLPMGKPDARALTLEVRGDGHVYKLSVRTDDNFDGVSHQVAFTPPADHWLRLELPFADFRAVFRGRAVPDAAPLDPARLRQLGLMIADRQAGRFALQVRTISLT